MEYSPPSSSGSKYEDAPLIDTVEVNASSPQRTITVLPLVFLIFFTVSGGPFGSEELIQAAGPLRTLLGLIIAPIVWSIPTALMTSELATAFPADGGPLVWGRRAFGDLFGFMLGMCRLVGNICDNALYPALFVTYLERLLNLYDKSMSTPVEYALRIGFSTFLTLFNVRGLQLVGVGSVIIGLLTMGPFVVLCIWGAFHTNPRIWVSTLIPERDVDYGTYVNILLWNLNAWEGVASFAGQVKEPGKTFPKSLAIAVVFVILSYAFPLMISVGMNPNCAEWGNGYFAVVASHLGGRPLAVFLLLGAAAATSALYMAALAANSYQFVGMAKEGYIPSVFARFHSKYDTPVVNIFLVWLLVIAITPFSFNTLLGIDTVFYGIGLVMQIITLLRLRWSEPDTERPYRIPMHRIVLVGFFMLPIACCVFIFVVTPKWSMLGAACIWFFSFALFYVFVHLKRRRVFKFEDPDYLPHFDEQ